MFTLSHNSFNWINVRLHLLLLLYKETNRSHNQLYVAHTHIHQDVSFTSPYLCNHKLNRSAPNYMLVRAQNRSVYGRLCPTGSTCCASSFGFITHCETWFVFQPMNCSLMQRRGCFLHFKSRPVIALSHYVITDRAIGCRAKIFSLFTTVQRTSVKQLFNLHILKIIMKQWKFMQKT